MNSNFFAIRKSDPLPGPILIGCILHALCFSRRTIRSRGPRHMALNQSVPPNYRTIVGLMA